MCKVGYLNVRTLRERCLLDKDGSLTNEASAEIEVLKQRVREQKFYALALEEVRLEGKGEIDVGEGFALIYSGIGGQAGVALLLSPGAVSAWKANGSKTMSENTGRILGVSLKLRGKEGQWHIFVV